VWCETLLGGLSRRSGMDVGRVLDVKATHLSGLLSRPLHTRHVHVQTQAWGGVACTRVESALGSSA